MTDREGLAQVLDEALAAIAAGADPAAVLAKHPDLAAELAPMLAAAQAAGAGQRPTAVPRPAQSASRAQFLAQAGRLRAGAVLPPTSRRPGRWPALRLARGWLAVLIVTAGLAGLSYGALTASAESLPGDALYSIKRAAEDVQLLLASGTQSKERLEAGFDERRAQEIQSLSEQGRQVRVDFTGWLVDLPTGSGHWLVAGIPIELAPDAQVEGSLVAGERVQVIGTVQPDRSVLAERVRVVQQPRASATATPTANSSATPPPTPSASATATPAASATGRPPTPAPSATDDVYGIGPSPSNTPQPTDDDGGGNDGSETPEATDDHGGPSASNTPQPTSDNGGPSASNTPQPTDDHGGPSASNTPQATDDHGGPSPSNTPKPTDDDDGGGGGNDGSSH